VVGLDFKISKNYALEFYITHLIRALSDGLTFFEFKVNLDRYYGDHCPRFEVYLILCNIMVFEARIYNINHMEKTYV